MAQNCGPIRYRENGERYRLTPETKKGANYANCDMCVYYKECLEEAKIKDIKRIDDIDLDDLL